MHPIIAPADLDLKSTRIIDARTGPDAHARFAQSHLRGAIFTDLETDLSAPTAHPERGGRHPLPPLETWAQTLGRWAIDPSTPVVVYDAAGGANAAARVWWMLRAVGHENVAVLDGGFDAAVRAGLPIDAEIPDFTAKPPYPATNWLLPIVDIDRVDALRNDPRYRLFDARARARFEARTEPIDPIAGHIPGAHNAPLDENLGPDGTFKSQEELRALYDVLRGDVAPDHLIASCGSGVTACHTLLALEIAGLSGAALYPGSWGEWCRSGRPRSPG